MTMRKFLLPLAALAALMPLSCRQPVEIPVVPDSAGGDDPAVVDPDPVFGGDVVFSPVVPTGARFVLSIRGGRSGLAGM